MTKKLGKYELIEELGRGGFATVYQARDPELDRLIALKVLHPQLTIDPKFIHRFRQEAQIAAGLSHRNIVTIYEVGEETGLHYLAMDYIRGQTLRDKLRAGPLNAEQAITIIEQIASALDAVHDKGLVHRDVKPANVMINEAGEAILLDFGIVRASEGTQQTSKMVSTGTALYMSPEQAQGQVDWRTDIYALGIMTYELLVGQPPFTGEDWVKVLYKHVNESPPVPSTKNPHLSPGLDEPLLKALAKTKENRFLKASDFAAQLRRALQMEAQEKLLAPLYQSLQTAAAAGDWSTVLTLAGQIQAKDPHYRDVPALIEQARRHLEAAQSKPASTPKPAPEPQPPAKSGWPGWIWLAGGGAVLILLVVCLGGWAVMNLWGSTPTPAASLPPTATFRPLRSTATSTLASQPAEFTAPTATPTATPTETAIPPTPPPTDTPVPPTPTPPPTDTPVPATKTPFPTNTPLPSPTPLGGGGRIAFQSDRDGTYQVYIANPDATDPICVTCSKVSGGNPAWSPDGTRIAFVSGQEGNLEIYLINVKTGETTRLTNNPDEDGHPTWAPDGKRIAFTSNRGDNDEICVINVGEALQETNNNVTCLTKNSASDRAPAWSPDGQRIAFHSNRDGNTDIYNIYLMNVDGSGQTRLMTNLTDSSWPVWSPDGTQLAFHSQRDGNWEIYVVNSDGSEPTRLTNNLADDQDPSWSPDGTHLAFDSQRDGNWEIYMMNIDGSGQINFTDNLADDRTPTWNLNKEVILN